MSSPIAIVGMACRYPDADTVGQLCENSLAGRQSFRTIPDQRLSPNYIDLSGASPDRACMGQAALIRGFRFDRERFRVSQASYQATDLTHWLSLTVAQEAVADITFRKQRFHPDRQAIRVVVGNSLAGEFSRSGLMRLRWPYVRGVLERHLRQRFPDGDGTEIGNLLGEIEADYKSPFPVPNEDYLAGGLSNTIAGRICNHFDFKGGGYTIDGACSSSLLAVADACSALAAGDADLVLAGGVDLSIDPFELVGFSRTAALARTEMRVYDERSEGFWPGEGCGFVALMRLTDALEACERIHAVIRGWGLSSDGKGGLTRPEVEGQAIALGRCYARAGYPIGSVGYFEGHGTGTKVGDTAELQALLGARRDGAGPIHPAVISSVKANIGHTKAAAGLAGLVRATACVAAEVLPPATACQRPHRLLAENPLNLRVLDRARAWDPGPVPRRAGVSAMGFGGINTHVTIEEAPTPPRTSVQVPGATDLTRFWAGQEIGLFLFSASCPADLAWTVDHLAEFADKRSRAELVDLAVELARRASRGALSPWKAAVVASTPEELGRRLRLLRGRIEEAGEEGENKPVHMDVDDGVFLSGGQARGRITLVFSGQAAPVRLHADAFERCFEPVGPVYRRAQLNRFAGRDDTGAAQPAIATASLAGLELLRWLGIDGDQAVGHSLGELAALHWAGCFDGGTLIDISEIRGRTMLDDPHAAGAMVAITADRVRVAALLAGRDRLFLSNINSPRQTVVAGDRDAVEAFAQRLRQDGMAATMLRLRQAFHTPAMISVADRLAVRLAGMDLKGPCRPVISTVTGAPLPEETDLAAHLRRQIVQPVNFLDAVSLAARDTDLFIEVGPGDRFAALVGAITDKPVIPLDVGAETPSSALKVLAAAYVLDRAPAIGTLFKGRFTRPYHWDWRPDFFQNPCETIPAAPQPTAADAAAWVEPAPMAVDPETDVADLLRRITSEITGLPAWTLQGASRMLSDLHLNSITVGEIINRFTAALGRRPVADPTLFVNASLDELRAIVEARPAAGAAGDPDGLPAGLDHWVRFFEVTQCPVAGPADGGGPSGDALREPGGWQIGGRGVVDGASLRDRLADGGHGQGVVVWLPPDPGADDLSDLLSAAHRCGAPDGDPPVAPRRLVVIQNGWGGSGFSRSFHLETPTVPTLVINLSRPADPRAADWIVREIDAAPPGFAEIFVDSTGAREEPRMRALRSRSAPEPLMGPGDVVLLCGGGKGISAECGFQLARRTGCALLILGRSHPDASPELQANLARFRDGGIRVSYQPADVTVPAEVAAALAAGTRDLGLPVTAIIHGAGHNRPRPIAVLTREEAVATIAPKIDGLRTLLGQVDPGQLRLLVTFSSIIGRIGLRGEADYALANEWLSRETEIFQDRHPGCRCRALEWSVWSGAGMGERLGRIDALTSQGITPISIDQGVEAFLRAVDAPDLPVRLVISGRFGGTDRFRPDRPPRVRFLERVPVFYPEVELVAECDLSAQTDPYLDDHALDGKRIFPAVMSLEAMAQAAAAVRGLDLTTAENRTGLVAVFRDLSFPKAIVLDGEATAATAVTLRLVALVTDDGSVSLAIRCSATNFQVNHVEARCRLERRRGPADGEALSPCRIGPLLPGDADRALYDRPLFQKGRFRKVAGYDRIGARRCSGRLLPAGGEGWFSPEHAPILLLGAAGVRDGALHSVQACVPHRILIPIRADSVEIDLAGADGGSRLFTAEEIADRGDEMVYDLTVLAEDGRPVEVWRGVTYRVVGQALGPSIGAVPLAEPFLERSILARRPDAGLTVAVRPCDGTGEDDTAHRPDGKPEPSSGLPYRSISRTDRWRLAVDSLIPVGCDLETVARKDEAAWAVLLGPEGAALAGEMARQLDEPLDLSATRVWTAREAVKKAGRIWATPLTLDALSQPRWTVLASAGMEVYSSTIQPPGEDVRICVAVALPR
jgi:enediyne polyketide synthase